MDYDVDTMTTVELKEAIVKLRQAIRSHRDEKGHDRCWLDDTTLYRILPEKKSADFSLPPKCEFLIECNRFWDRRQPELGQEIS